MGVVALAKPKKISFETLKLSQNPLLLVLEKVEKPGNLGAILRTADAANVDAVIICDPQTDIYNPNVIRSGIGCVFTKQVVACSNKECIAFLKEKGISIFSTALTASKPYTEINFTVAAAIVMGTEATGLTQEWLENSTQNIIIPMLGEIDSMNVSVSAAIVVFEALRQRNLVK
jgi:RNA methyltransferase, TrmH family